MIVFITFRIKRWNSKHILLIPYALKLCRGHKFAARGVEKRLQPVQAWQRRAKYLRFLKQISSIYEDSEGSQIRGN
ncbi:TPA: hypothetical protein I7707_10410 [Vibrio vulnificus]|nr:hypothetical protein OA19_04060 [Vibrio vulnificus]KHF92901.1 hypothetical protein OA16_03665 [Vibrio vulnificus]RZR33660.1 hypothetical protein D8T61_04030 [Vibrio vulnificus]HAS8094107.1 hypothetical protein [Vibrio vulnificus]HAS8289120.1 hypothetical protein [Vibrio vulnificus]